jgi:hypothetical protein
MPSESLTLPPRLIEAAAAGNLVPFIGAGISRSASTSDPHAFPTWRTLLKELAKTAVDLKVLTPDERSQIEELVEKDKYLMAGQALRSVLPPDAIDELLIRRYQPPDAKPGAIHRSIFKLHAPLIITTNYDLLLEDAYAEEYGRVPQPLTYKEANRIQTILQSHRLWHDRPNIFKIHGTASIPSEAILGEMDYRTLLYREPGYRLVLSAVFVTKVVLMLGFSFDDPELRLLMESLRDSLKYRSMPDYILIPKGKKGSVELKRWHEDFGLQALEYDASNNHREIIEIIDYLASFVKQDASGAHKSLPTDT